jgi:Protein of unknown function (DUF3011)
MGRFPSRAGISGTGACIVGYSLEINELRLLGPGSTFGGVGQSRLLTKWEAEIKMRILRILVVLSGVVCALAGAAKAQDHSSGGRQVSCSSDDGRRRYCPANTRAGVALEKQTSGAECRQGYSWDFDEGGIWVDHGCRAYFRVEYERPGENRGSESIVRCSSNDGGRHYCEADTRGDVDLIRQHSEAACLAGYSWGFDERGIWVDHGCRAEFVAQPYERPDHLEKLSAPVQSLYCASDDGRRNFCQVDTRGGVQLVKQRSGAACRQGYSWDFDERGIWVDHGCRADFVARGRGEDHDEGHHQGQECRRSIGEDRARELVEQCRQVSPGTHPPCSAENSCRVITDEIRRSCQLLGRDGPRFCEEYR